MSSTVPALPAGVTRDGLTVGDDDVQILRGGDGPPLLFLHAAGGAGAWLPVHAQLAERFTVFAPDHPGFAGSGDFAALDDVEDLAFHYADLIAALGLDRPAVVGTSFGGWIAAELASYRPALVSGLVLANPIGIYLEGDPIRDLFAMSPQQKLEALFHDPSAAAGIFPAEPDLAFILAMARDEASFARFAWAPFCHDPRLPRLLPRVEAPTLVLWGASDTLMSPAYGERYAELIPGAQLQTIPDCGHAAALERPDEVTSRVGTFLSA